MSDLILNFLFNPGCKLNAHTTYLLMAHYPYLTSWNWAMIILSILTLVYINYFIYFLIHTIGFWHCSCDYSLWVWVMNIKCRLCLCGGCTCIYWYWSFHCRLFTQSITGGAGEWKGVPHTFDVNSFFQAAIKTFQCTCVFNFLLDLIFPQQYCVPNLI